jgi:hypothetical protein
MFRGRFVGSIVGLYLGLPQVALSAFAADMRNLRGDDRIFFTGFEVATTTTHTADFDDVVEGFEGASWTYEGIHFHDVNGADAVFPDGSTVDAEELGDQLTIENASVFYDGTGWGSWPNALTFGGAYINGNNFSVGPLARVSMDMEAVMESVGFDLAYYENGPWGNIELHLDAYLEGAVTGSDMLTIADDFRDRDNLTTAHFSIVGVAFDSLKLYATYANHPSAPRVMIDHLVTSMRSAGR